MTYISNRDLQVRFRLFRVLKSYNCFLQHSVEERSFKYKFRVLVPDFNSLMIIITSARTLRLLPVSVCWLVGWFVTRITQKLQNGFPPNLDGG